jgi:quercetin dioxygenase-like cupin family protein
MNRHSDWRFRIRLALLVAPAALVFVSAFAQQPQTQPPPQTANMTGKGGFIDSADLRVSRIRFEPGARTYWHIHSAGQVIVAEEGEGLYQEQGSGIRNFVPGQAAYLKPNIAHWHGATPKVAVVQATMYGGMLKWLEAVTDEEYLGKKTR